MSGVPIKRRRGVGQKKHKTLSDLPVERLYAWRETGDFDPAEEVGEPGGHPFTRGVFGEHRESAVF